MGLDFSPPEEKNDQTPGPSLERHDGEGQGSAVPRPPQGRSVAWHRLACAALFQPGQDKCWPPGEGQTA